VKFKVLGEIRDVETIAVSYGIRDLPMLTKRFGAGRWRKLKGFAAVEFANGTVAEAELHWYEAHGIGRRLMKVKRVIRR
jgi:nucleotidyltransferase/DNA polymerase involved in DNA repair